MEMPEKKTKGGPSPIDEHVGVRLRVRRTLVGMSQEKLADAVGLTFQQVQKYERGTNRVSAGRLYQFAQILDVPVAYFFENFGNVNLPSGTPESAYGMADQDQEPFGEEDLLNRKETLDLIRVYYSIEDQKLRKDLYKIIKSMADSFREKK